MHFPAYSPELDPIEQSWRAAKKWLAIRYWENKSQMKEQLVTALNKILLAYQFTIILALDYNFI